MIWETIKMAVHSLQSNKLRTLLSMLGIIIGVGAVIAVISIAAGSQQEVTSSIAEMGSNLINIRPGTSRGRFGRFSKAAQNVFTMELAEAIVDYCPSVIRIAPRNETSGHFVFAGNNYLATLTGTTTDFLVINKYRPEHGKFFNNYDLTHANNVIVLGSDLAKELFAGLDPVGRKITFLYNQHSLVFNIIGVMEEKERGISGDLNSSAYIPITTYLQVISNSRYINSFLAQAASSEVAGAAVEEIKYLLTKYLKDGEEFNLFSQDQLLQTITEISGTMTLMLSGIAAISLLVGGIGIMNIMLVSVTERTREVGIRKALGAKKKHILTQFLIEALTMSCTGGILGIIFGEICAYLTALLGNWPFVISPLSILLAFSFSLTVGVFFGIYPAVKAARLDPVIALSYE